MKTIVRHRALALQVEFNLLEAEAQFGVVMDGLDVEPFEVGTGTATSDYYLVLGHAGRRITGRLEYNAELFLHESAQQMAADWQVGDSAICNLLQDVGGRRSPLPLPLSPAFPAVGALTLLGLCKMTLGAGCTVDAEYKDSYS